MFFRRRPRSRPDAPIPMTPEMREQLDDVLVNSARLLEEITAFTSDQERKRSAARAAQLPPSA